LVRAKNIAGYSGSTDSRTAVYIRASGVVEFTLAFALLWTPLVRRSDAVILVVMFVGAILEFSKLDVIGYAPIVVVLLAIFGDNIAMPRQPRPLVLAAPVTALAGFLTVYHVTRLQHNDAR
jgi:hypothetical protein